MNRPYSRSPPRKFWQQLLLKTRRIQPDHRTRLDHPRGCQDEPITCEPDQLRTLPIDQGKLPQLILYPGAQIWVRIIAGRCGSSDAQKGWAANHPTQRGERLAEADVLHLNVPEELGWLGSGNSPRIVPSEASGGPAAAT